MKTKHGFSGTDLLAALCMFAAIYTDIVTSQTVRWSIEAPRAGTKAAGSRLITSHQMTTSLKNAIVDAHNSARSSANPPPADMMKITWNDDLARIAIAYAKTCTFGINRAKKLQRFNRIEENIYVSTGITFGNQWATQATGRWNEEGKYYNYQTNKCTATDRCKRYTQMVWGPTFKVGCGISKCSAVKVGRQTWTDATIMVCDYAPGGNWITRRPYVTGPVCSECHATDRCVNNLCTNPARDSATPPVAAWSQWTTWTACSKTCGVGGTRRRSRYCNTFYTRDCLVPGRYSPSSDVDNKCSINIPCTGGSQQAGSWGRWDSNWSTCSATCGGGQKSKTRTCSTGRLSDCTGSNRISFPCNGRPCPGWNDWRPWEGCSQSCGGGTRIRTRACSTGTDTDCQGSASETGNCNTQRCQSSSTSQGTWGAWSAWGSCSATCGSSTRKRTRRCSGTCRTGLATSQEACTKPACPAAARFSQWTQWSACSKTCGTGTSARSRNCIKPQGSTARCQGSATGQKPCQKATCAPKRTWSSWRDWGSCSVTCGSGSQTRTRTCSAGSGPSCPGSSSDRKTCTRSACPTLSNWSRWSSCSVTCGSGQQERTRSCSSGRESDCSGSKRNTRPCTLTACTTSRWGVWGTWSACSRSCGSGRRSRSRTCNLGNSGPTCQGLSVESQTCNRQTCPSFSKWTTWSKCSKTCGPGTRERSRRCSSGRTTDCSGEPTQSESCNDVKCTVSSWTQWTLWTSCTKTCGTGNRQRTRTCTKGNSGPTCAGQGTSRIACNSRVCPTFDPWGQWSQCSAACGTGEQTRTRTCSSGKPQECQGNSEDRKVCRQPTCQTSKWAPWGSWTQCSKSCGGGQYTRKRTCDEGNSGPTCVGVTTDSGKCNTQTCPTFLPWQTWNACSVTCGSGTRSRSRSCSSGISSDCTGPTSATETCSKPSCSLSVWGTWQTWSGCSHTCGSGSKSRTRVCQIGNSGPPCQGSRSDTDVCNVAPCPAFSPWSDWSKCPVTCGVGTISRSRACNTGVNSDCVGNHTENNKCTKPKCAVSAWSPWAPWSDCTQTCGTGTKTRLRVCNRGATGTNCAGSSTDQQNCNSQACPLFSPWTSWSTCSVTCGQGQLSKTRTCSTRREKDCNGPTVMVKSCSVPITCATTGNTTANPNNDKQFGGGTTTTSNCRKSVYSFFLIFLSFIVSSSLSF
uniref:A disintegrin and metalloproteinase with thrombospondin motifs gon-1 n=1 Tax=Phallusia mammillata TaxID=59560 RepID=A0A6F9DDB1_9ASCI|nr:A disintegrin and metalloproteinase with thrombospondin motifs gon-1 [Phallusia mammillata]